MRSLRVGLLLGFASLFTTLAGCSSSPSASPDAAGGFQLGGVYVTNGLGPISQLEFVDATHAVVSWTDCGEGKPCTSTDTYSVNEAATELTLTEPGGNTTVLDFAALEEASLSDDSLHVQGIGLTSGDATTLVSGGDAGPLVSGDGGPLTLKRVPLVTQFSVKLNSGCVQLFKMSGTFSNDKTAYDFFRSKGLSAVQAAGIIGNLDQESGDNPASVQPGGAGRGIAQWSTGGRWNTGSTDNATAYATSQNLSLNSLQLQLEFIWFELTTYSHYGLSALQQATNITQATQVFASDFEACGKCIQAQRDIYAQNAYNAFSGDKISTPDAGSDGGICSAGSLWGSCTVGDQSGTCISTSSCASEGKTSTPLHCPGPVNIQCCTRS